MKFRLPLPKRWAKKCLSAGAVPTVVMVQPGQIYVTTRDELITTILGSCVAVCIRDRFTGVGGMNHFLLPEQRAGICQSEPDRLGRYGHFAMQQLIDDLIHAGGHYDHFECKLFGGCSVLQVDSQIGRDNIQFAREYLQAKNLVIQSESTGHLQPLKIRYRPATGQVQVKKLGLDHSFNHQSGHQALIDR